MRLWDVFTLPEACAGTEKYPCLCNDYEKIKNRAAQYHLKKPFAFVGEIYLICVKKNSRAFHRLISGVSQQDKDRYVLPAGIVFDEKMLYLSKITGNPEIKMQKQELFEILGL